VILIPDVDAYGKYARVSAIADYVELLAIKGLPISPTLLADFISDNDWSLEELIRPAGAAAAEPIAETAAEAADRVFLMINERIALLGNLYPFEIWKSHLRLKGASDLNTSAYAALLAITLVHAYRIPAPHIPYQVFEETVAGIVVTRGLQTADVGTVARRAASFETALDEVATRVGLTAFRAAAPTYLYAQDERVDTLCHFSWGDNRPGAWTMVGQATCAKSEAWDKKISEPPAPTWEKLLGVGLRPRVFLAVPHHVGELMLEKLVSDRKNLVLDRLRLVRFKNGVSQREAGIIVALLAVEVERP
jgi:hypothetical protein